MAASSDKPEVMKATRSLDNSEVHSFFYFLLQKLILIHEYYTMLLTCQLAFVDWRGYHVD